MAIFQFYIIISLMKIHLKLACFALLLGLSSCEKISTLPIISILVPKPPTKPPIGDYRTIDVGIGQGDLVVDGSTMTLQCNDHIRIAKGSYNSITIKNFDMGDNCGVVITNGGLVELNGDFKSMNLSNLDGVTISGDGDPSITYGFQFHDNVYRSVEITRPFNRATLQFVSFKNIKDYVVNYQSEVEYNGTNDSYSKDLKFLNLLCENTGTLLQLSGAVENNKITGYIKGLEIANVNYSNSDNVGTVVSVGNVEDYDIHNNTINNINAANNNHNGIFHVAGNGKFHDNSITNHQGNALRAWTFTIGNKAKEILIYNNIVVNSRKYSAFEAQSFSTYMSSKVTYANTKVYNNTCGNLNNNKDWYGEVVDLYNLEGGSCTIFNNLAFNFPAPNPSDNITNQQASTSAQMTSNLYFKNIADVGFSSNTKYTLNASSKAKNSGEAVSLLLKDFYGSMRNTTTPSVGAVE